MRRVFSAFIATFLLIPISSVWAQQAQEEFGKNRIQYRQYTWQYVSSEHFKLYYYDGRKGIATRTIRYLEEEFGGITDRIGYVSFYKQTVLFLYSSMSDLQQSNIGLYHVQFDAGGETEIRHHYAQIVHRGSLEELEKQAVYKVTELWVNEIMFGSGLKSALKSAVLLSLPDWYVSGVSSYIANGWSVEMDNYIRQLFYTKRVRRVDSFKGEEAKWIGQSIWNYIAEKYGVGNISSILNYTRVISNVRRSISIMLGVSFKKFIDDWYQFYFEMGQRVQQDYVFPEDSTRITRQLNRSAIYTMVKLSPDGTKVAYTENDRGRFTVKVKSLVNNGAEITILRGGSRVFDQEVDYNTPLVDWVNPSQLGVIGIKRGTYFFWLYDLNTHSKSSRKMQRFNNIRSIDFSDNGRLAVLSADRDGNNDLFLISTRRDRTRRLTHDADDDFDPSFLPNTQTIVFSSNRTNDTINTVVKNIAKASENYNLYLFNLDTTIHTVVRVTNAVGKNYQPRAYDKNTIYYLSDQRGIVNLFKYNLSTGVYTQVTNFNSNIQKYDLNFASNQLAFILRKKMKTGIFFLPQFNYTKHVFSPSTPRVTSQQAKVIVEKRASQSTKNYHSVKELVDTRLKEVQGGRDSNLHKSDSSKTPSPALPDKLSPSVDGNAGKTVQTQSYVFEDEMGKKGISSERLLSKYKKVEKKRTIKGPILYKPAFIYNNLITNVIIDPLFGYGMKLETQMNDVFENYRFFGGLQFAFNQIESGGFFAEAQYLPHRIDYSARIERKALIWEGTTDLQKYTWQKIEVGASLPFSVRWRIAAKPFLGYADYLDRGVKTFPLPTPPTFKSGKQQFYAGAKIELVYDNSVTTGLNTIEGTRGKINLITYEGLGNEKASFSHIFADIRHYQRLYKEIVFALRGYMGSFFGNSPKQYVLGGMNDWFGNMIQNEGGGSPLARLEGFNYNLIFTEFATSMRGFNYAALYGNNVVLANVELRVPLIRVLSTGPVSSKFLKNIQLTSFFDIGTSWLGSFFNFAEATSTRTVPEKPASNPFRIDVVDNLNPWIYSYGAGLRARILGFYTKFDVAWPVQNYHQGKAHFYVTLGLDF